MMRKTLSLIGLVLVAGCGSSQPEAQTETAAPVVSASAAPTPVVTAEPTPVPSAAPSSAPTSTSGSIPPPSGRAALGFEDAAKITQTVGASPPAKFELTKDKVTFKIPEWALTDGINVTFLVDAKAPKAKGGSGNTFHLFAQVPPAEDASLVTSRGPAFTIKIPYGKIASPNLAIGEIVRDSAGKEKITWKVIAPKSKDDTFANFEFTTFQNDYLQLTTDAPSP